MPRLWPRMAYEAPPAYVSFVERHIDELRRDAADVVGGESDADRLYPEVLTDVAARWSRLELTRKLLGRSRAADDYLRRAFERRSLRWRSDEWRSTPNTVSEIEVWGPQMRVWSDDPPSDEPAYRGAPPPPELSSAALRLAPHVAPERPPTAAPVADALVAWWHAYAAWRRRQIITGIAAVFILLALAGRTSPEPLSAPADVQAPVVQAPVVQVTGDSGR